MAIPSYKRAQNVQNMRTLIGGEVTWIIHPQEEEEYRTAGAKSFLFQKGLVDARNVALEAAFALGLPCLMSDDDLKVLKVLGEDGKAHHSDFERYVTDFLKTAETTQAKLVGVAPTNNPFYGSMKVSQNSFIIASLMMVFPSELRFDETCSMREDYDLTLQHLAKFGKVARCDWLLPEYQHYTNSGGLLGIRNEERNLALNNRLKEKWGAIIKDHPRRAGEITMRWDREAYELHKRRQKYAKK